MHAASIGLEKRDANGPVLCDGHLGIHSQKSALQSLYTDKWNSEMTVENDFGKKKKILFSSS